MIFIIEIPHQAEPTVWSRATEEQVMDVIAAAADHSGATIDGDDFESHLDWNGHDLNNQLVFMSEEEARAALDDAGEWGIHQGIKARLELQEALGDMD